VALNILLHWICITNSDASRTYFYRDAIHKLSHAIGHLNSESPPVNFIVNLGDLIDGNTSNENTARFYTHPTTQFLIFHQFLRGQPQRFTKGNEMLQGIPCSIHPRCWQSLFISGSVTPDGVSKDNICSFVKY
jgi:hypothetical protein